MKKNNSYESINVKKQYFKLVLTNMIAYFLVFVVLGLVMILSSNTYFFKDIENSLKVCEEDNKTRISKGMNEYRFNNQNNRINVVLYNEDLERVAYSRTLLNYFIKIDDMTPDPLSNEEIGKYLDDSSISKVAIDKIDETIFEEENGYKFMTLSFEVNSPMASEVKYCKLIIMINGEVAARDKIINVYLMISATLLLLGFLASIIVSKRAIKPIGDSLEKQLAFVSDASHELRTPLAIVQSKLENILTKKDSSVMEVSGDIAVSLKEVERLSKLTNELLTLARSDNDTTTIDFQLLNIKESLNNTIDIFKEMAELDGRYFNYDISDIYFIHDKQKLIELMVILLDNAIKYTLDGDSIDVAIYKEGNNAIIKVSDTGIGISDETMKRIFERFYREDKARSRATGGNGLGLAIAKTIVLEHNGKIIVDHNNPKGTVFTIAIPIKK